MDSTLSRRVSLHWRVRPALAALLGATALPFLAVSGLFLVSPSSLGAPPFLWLPLGLLGMGLGLLGGMLLLGALGAIHGRTLVLVTCEGSTAIQQVAGPVRWTRWTPGLPEAVVLSQDGDLELQLAGSGRVAVPLEARRSLAESAQELARGLSVEIHERRGTSSRAEESLDLQHSSASQLPPGWSPLRLLTGGFALLWALWHLLLPLAPEVDAHAALWLALLGLPLALGLLVLVWRSARSGWRLEVGAQGAARLTRWSPLGERTSVVLGVHSAPAWNGPRRRADVVFQAEEHRRISLQFLASEREVAALGRWLEERLAQ